MPKIFRLSTLNSFNNQIDMTKEEKEGCLGIGTVLFIGIALGIIFTQLAQLAFNNDDLKAELIEEQREREEDEKRERQERLEQDYDDYCWDIDKINWEIHCREVLYSFGPPPPDFTWGRKHAWEIVWLEVREFPMGEPRFRTLTFEEFKNP